MTANEKKLCDLLDEIILRPTVAVDPDWTRRALEALDEASKPEEIKW